MNPEVELAIKAATIIGVIVLVLAIVSIIRANIANKTSMRNNLAVILFLLVFFGGWFGLLGFVYFTMRNPESAPLNVGAIYPVVIGIILVLVGLYLIKETMRRTKETRNTGACGRIIGAQYVMVPSGDGEIPRYCAVVEYKDCDGVKKCMQSELYYYNQEDVPVGDEVAVYPDGKVESMSKEPQNLKGVIPYAILTIVMGLIAIGAGLENFVK